METWSHPEIFLRLSTNFYFISFTICHIAVWLPYFLQFLRPPAHGRLKYGVLLVQWQVLVMRRKSTPMHPNYLTLRTVRKKHFGTNFYSLKIGEKFESRSLHEFTKSMKIREKTKNDVLRAARATDQWTHLCRQSVTVGSETMQTNSLRSGQLRPRIQGTGQRPSSSSAQLLVTGDVSKILRKKPAVKLSTKPFLINHSIPFLFFACCWEYHRGPPAKDCRSFPWIQIHKVQQKSN